MAADYQADGREPGLHVQGHGRGVRASARPLYIWRGDHHDKHGRGGNHHLRHHAVCEAMMFYALAFFNVFVAAVAQMLLKKAAITPHKSIIKEYLNPWVIGGYSLMVFSLVSNVYVLSQGVLLKELGTIEAASYLFVPVLAFVCFKEKINLRKVAAIALILAGVVVFFWE